jgi:hypothetical protein
MSQAGCQKGMPKDFKFPPFQYVMCEHLDFGWPVHMLPVFRQWWDDGMSINEMAQKFRRRAEEVLLLAIDQLEHGWIKPRPGGIWGCVK